MSGRSIARRLRWPATLASRARLPLVCRRSSSYTRAYPHVRLGSFVAGSDSSKAIKQLGDPAIRRVLWISLGLSLLVFALLWTASATCSRERRLFQIGWLDTAIDVLGGFATLALSWLLFPAVVSTTTGFLLEGVAEAVERRHYPDLPPARSQPLEEVLASTVQVLRCHAAAQPCRFGCSC